MINSLPPSYSTALIVALLKGAENPAVILLARGANSNIDIDPEYMVDLRTDYNRRYIPFLVLLYKTPIEAAIVGGKLSMMKLLLKSGVLPSQSTLDFANDVRHRNCQHVKYHDSLDYSAKWNFRPSWESLGTSSREDSEIVIVLEEALKHQND